MFNVNKAANSTSRWKEVYSPEYEVYSPEYEAYSPEYEVYNPEYEDRKF
jgi:hypothetical protein